jgi:NitT/TauT family transport system substrate-binding protein
MNFFRDGGLDTQISEASNGAVIANAIAAGAADIGFSNLTSVAIAYAKGIPFTIVAPGSVYDRNTPTSAMLVPKTSTVQSARDLNGKTIGTPGLGTITEYAVRTWIDKNGGKSKTVHFIEMAQPVIPDALVAGRIDATILSEPWLYVGKRVARVLANAYDAIAPHFLIGVFFANEDWARVNAPTIARFQAVLSKTAAWANAHHAESGHILAKYGKYPPDAIESMLRIAYQGAMDPADLQPLLNVLAQYGALNKSVVAQKMIFRS